jgi:hypothetical protein
MLRKNELIAGKKSVENVSLGAPYVPYNRSNKIKLVLSKKEKPPGFLNDSIYSYCGHLECVKF